LRTVPIRRQDDDFLAVSPFVGKGAMAGKGAIFLEGGFARILNPAFCAHDLAPSWRWADGAKAA
jgi:hypothetical protein